MARPARRVIKTIAMRLGISFREVEKWSLEDIREYMVLLRPEKPSAADPSTLDQTPEQLEAGLMAAFGKPKVTH